MKLYTLEAHVITTTCKGLEVTYATTTGYQIRLLLFHTTGVPVVGLVNCPLLYVVVTKAQCCDKGYVTD